MGLAHGALVEAKSAEVAAARAVTSEAEGGPGSASAPMHSAGSPELPAPPGQVERIRERVSSLQALLGNAQVGVEKLAPALSTEWEAYAASDTQPKLTQTVWLVQRVASSLVTELITPAMQQCTAVLQPEPIASPSAAPPCKKPRHSPLSPRQRPRSWSPGAGRRRGSSRTPPRRRADADPDPNPALGATVRPAACHPVFVAAGARHNA